MTKISEKAVGEFVKSGFLRISLDESATDAVNAVYQAAFLFFRSGSEEKILNKLPEGTGYRPFGIEYSKSPDVPDQIESFTTSKRTQTKADTLPTLAAQQLCEKMLIVSGHFESIAETLIFQLAESFGVSGVRQRLNGAFRNWSRLQLNYSRPAATKTDFINEVHEDGVLITLTCATGDGLEVENERGSFVPMTTPLGEAIVLAGEITWLLSGGLINPAYHRVRPKNNQCERLALVFLGDIDPKLCQPWAASEKNKNVDIGARVLSSAGRFGLEGFSADGERGGDEK